MATITKKYLLNRIADKTGQSKVVTNKIIQLFLDSIIKELGNGNRLEFREFGVFEIKRRPPRKALDPITLEKVHVPAKKVVKFKAGRLMKEKVCGSATSETIGSIHPSVRPNNLEGFPFPKELEGDITTGAFESELPKLHPALGTSEFFFVSQILSAIDMEPVEDGLKHPAEIFIKTAIVNHEKLTIEWLNNLVLCESNASLIASILKCVGRLELDLCKGWGFDLINKALQHRDTEVRDAAVQALELWGNSNSIRLLKEHFKHEKILWLKEYVKKIIDDLEEN